jgi:hypothetical protein
MLRKHPIQGMETGIPPSYPSPFHEEGLADQKATRSCQTSPIVIVVEVQVSVFMDDSCRQPTDPCLAKIGILRDNSSGFRCAQAVFVQRKPLETSREFMSESVISNLLSSGAPKLSFINLRKY